MAQERLGQGLALAHALAARGRQGPATAGEPRATVALVCAALSEPLATALTSAYAELERAESKERMLGRWLVDLQGQDNLQGQGKQLPFRWPSPRRGFRASQGLRTTLARLSRGDNLDSDARAAAELVELSWHE